MLPFTRDAFVQVFAAYNNQLWPLVVLLWVLAALAFAAMMHAPQRHRFVTAVLVVQWTWAALAYHLAFFTAINPAAWLFAVLFLVEAALLFWYGVLCDGIRFSSARSARVLLGWGLVAYSLLYPLIAIAEGHVYPRTPTFGLPCPATILTLGALLAAERPLPVSVAVVPTVWAAIGGSAAVLLGVRADLMLPLAALMLIANLIATPSLGRQPAPS
jgi:hypothetical protein